MGLLFPTEWKNKNHVPNHQPVFQFIHFRVPHWRYSILRPDPEVCPESEPVDDADDDDDDDDDGDDDNHGQP